MLLQINAIRSKREPIAMFYGAFLMPKGLDTLEKDNDNSGGANYSEE
jgi:hypothetical protein